MTGFEDPFNRRPYPWGREDQDLVAYCAKLGNYRKTSRPLREGDIRWGTCGECLVSFVRRAAGESVAVAVSNARTRTIVELPWGHVQAVDVFTGERYLAMNGKLRLTLPPRGKILLESAPEGEKIGKITKKIP